MPPADDPLAAARALFARETHGVLCSAHAPSSGWPYGSVVPYALSDNGDPVVFVSDIAEHTQNLARDPRATLLVRDTQLEDPQAAARHAMMARARRPAGAEAAALEATYFARFPGAARMREAHGFSAWVLECERVRWIAGFGSMGWFDREEWTGEPDPLAAHADAIVLHLNDDHAPALLELAVAAGAAEATAARAVGVDRGGLELTARGGGGERQLRASFFELASTPDEARAAVIALLRDARS